MAKIIMTPSVKSPCIFCNCVPHDDTKENRPPLDMFHARGVDVNWGEDANICQICAGVMADMMDRPSAEAHEKLYKQARQSADKYNELLAKYEAQSERIRTILAGRKATKEQKEAA